MIELMSQALAPTYVLHSPFSFSLCHSLLLIFLSREELDILTHWKQILRNIVVFIKSNSSGNNSQSSLAVQLGVGATHPLSNRCPFFGLGCSWKYKTGLGVSEKHLIAWKPCQLWQQLSGCLPGQVVGDLAASVPITL